LGGNSPLEDHCGPASEKPDTGQSERLGDPLTGEGNARPLFVLGL
jgi:hypothetical protein